MGGSWLDGPPVRPNGRGIFIKTCILLVLCILVGCTFARQTVGLILSGPGLVLFFLSAATAVETCAAFRSGKLEVEGVYSVPTLLSFAALSQTPVMGVFGGWFLIERALNGGVAAMAVVASLLGAPFCVFVVGLPVILAEAAAISWMADI